MSYETIIGQYYDHGTVISVDIDVDIKKHAGGTYKGSRVTYRDDKDEIRDAKFAKGYIDITPFQAALKNDVSEVKAGDQITLYKEHCYKTAEGAGLTPAEIKEKKIARYSVRRIHKGHIVPEEMGEAAAPAAAGGAAAPKKSFNRDTTGIETGHAINAARILLTPAKAKDSKTLVKASQALHDLTVKLKGEYKVANPEASDYDAGAKVGHGILNACADATKFADVEGIYNTFISGVVEEVTAYVKGSKTAAADEAKAAKAEAAAKVKADKEAEEAAKAAESVNEVADEDEDIPF